MTARNVAAELENGVDLVGKGAAYAAVRDDGSVVTRGSADDGGTSDAVEDHLAWVVRRSVGNRDAFAAAKEDQQCGARSGGGGSGLCSCEGRWLFHLVGDAQTAEATPTRSKASGVRHIVGNWEACAAVKGDGSVVTCRLRKRFSLRAGALFIFTVISGIESFFFFGQSCLLSNPKLVRRYGGASVSSELGHCNDTQRVS